MGTCTSRQRFFKHMGIAIIFAVFVGAGLLHLIARSLVTPSPCKVGPPPEALHAEVVHIRSSSGSMLVGWLSEVPHARSVALLLHGIRSDRRSMIGRAEFLRGLGYTTLCVDLQGHGESPGARITLGRLESKDAESAVAYLQAKYPGGPLVVFGTSLGGAAAVLAHYETPPDAFVLEAVFADIETAVRNRLEWRLGFVGRLTTPLLTWQVKPLLGVSAAELSPVRAMARVHQPVFLLYGGADHHATLAEGRAMYDAAQGSKTFWEVPGAEHIDFLAFSRAEYERRLTAFLATLDRKSGEMATAGDALPTTAP